jgi:hypothetical protein
MRFGPIDRPFRSVHAEPVQDRGQGRTITWQAVHRAARKWIFHQRREAPSKPNWVSGEITVHPDYMSWAAIRRSNGSRCASGSLPER